MVQKIKQIPRALTIAGSDSGGGAGIQADLKTFSALQVYGMSAITAITAQNTKEVSEVFELPAELVAAQIKAVTMDIGVDAVKTGMLLSSRIISIVAKSIMEFNLPNFVLDPVMTAKSGDTLLEKSAIDSLINDLLPLAYVLTPNIPEAEILTKSSLTDEASIKKALWTLKEMGPKNVIIKGGHRKGEPVDWVLAGDNLFSLVKKRIHTSNTHGGGCTFASAITSFLARGMDLEKSIWNAKEYIHNGIAQSLDIGHGHGPLHHFHPWYQYKF